MKKYILLLLVLLCGTSAHAESLIEQLEHGLAGAAYVGYWVGKGGGSTADLKAAMEAVRTGHPEIVEKWKTAALMLNSTPLTTEWKMENGNPLIKVVEISGKTYEVGLRSDGVVVWREVKP